MTEHNPADVLLPCPFCASPAVRLVSGGPGNHYVLCEGCRATSDDCERARAIERWNTRTPEAADEIERLRACLIAEPM